MPGEAVAFVARQVQVPASERGAYEWTGRRIEYHRAQIRGHLGFRECTVAEADKLMAWLAEHVACKERRPEQVRVDLLARCRTRCIEPPAPGRCDPAVTRPERAAGCTGPSALCRRRRHEPRRPWRAGLPGPHRTDSTRVRKRVRESPLYRPPPFLFTDARWRHGRVTRTSHHPITRVAALARGTPMTIGVGAPAQCNSRLNSPASRTTGSRAARPSKGCGAGSPCPARRYPDHLRTSFFLALSTCAPTVPSLMPRCSPISCCVSPRTHVI
ncbi:DUF4158 domain-containing protein [Streptomyces dangxiongensis]|uniref:DUF4158 domain-containing protein n=1 Tax=Streptomyces dangxiongensis TaxID=1442032 RepID=A0A3G2JQM7_9ACTN|nr:DUF4158 domain-containing protein [Streptomyces dangxiongensis]